MSFRSELIIDLFNLNKEKSIRATKFAEWETGFRLNTFEPESLFLGTQENCERGKQREAANENAKTR